jgi:hypothetical protein
MWFLWRTSSSICGVGVKAETRRMVIVMIIVARNEGKKDKEGGTGKSKCVEKERDGDRKEEEGGDNSWHCCAW